MKSPRERIIIISVFLILLFIFYSTVVFSAGGITLSAKSAVLYDPSSKKFLYTKNESISLPMASTTKIMTALVAIENSQLDTEVSISDNAIGTEGSSLYLKHGEVMTMSDLLMGLMLRSANDAASAIAYEISGSIEAFAEKMNEKALQIGAVNTHFTNPHGLDDKSHYTTAKDLALIAAEALNNNKFLEIVSTEKCIIKNQDGEARLLINHNKLLNLYDGAIGIKTGFTKKSGRCLVGAAERNGIRLISVTINAPDDWNDHKKLFDFGFSTLKSIPLTQIKNDIQIYNGYYFSDI